MPVLLVRAPVGVPAASPSRFCYSRSTGFTLVELVIALALIGLITLLLFAGLRLGTRAWEGVEARAERTEAPRVARNFLTRELTQARPMQITFDAQKILIFSGDAETLEFVAPLSEHVGTSGLYILRLSLERGDAKRLILTRWLLHSDVLGGSGDIPEWAPFDGSSGPADDLPLEEDVAAGAYGSTLLLDDVGDLAIRYFGIAEGDQDPEWHEEWLQQPRMPLAIRVRLTTEQQTWPDILIRLPQLSRS